MFVEQLDGAPEVSVAHGLMREVHVRNILVDARGGFLGFGLAPQTRFLDLQRQRLMFGAGGADRLPKTQACGGEDGQRDRGGGQKGGLVAGIQFAHTVSRGRRTGDHWFAMQIIFHLRGKVVHGRVPARAILLDALHDHPVQVAAQGRNQCGCFAAAAGGGGGQFRFRQAGETGGWAGRLVFANGAATLLDRRAH